MEQVIDALVAELDILADLDFDEGGFADQIALAGGVWWGDPGILAVHQYPAAFVVPVRTTDAQGTNAQTWRNHEVQIMVLADPRNLFDTTEVVESTAMRELVRAGSVIERRLETINLAMPGGLSEGSRSITLTETSYPPQERGGLLLASVIVSVTVQKAYARAKQ